MIECGHCKTEKEPSEFHKSSARKTGRQFHCKVCQAEINLRRYHNKLSSDNSYKEKKASYDKKRRSEKSEELRAYDKDRSKLPHRRAAHNEGTRKRRALLKDAIPENYDREGVLAMYALAQKFSELTGVEMHVDHIKPISKGGEHNVDNLQLLASQLNIAKGDREDFQLSWEAYPK